PQRPTRSATGRFSSSTWNRRCGCAPAKPMTTRFEAPEGQMDMKKRLSGLAALPLALMAGLPVWAQEAVEAAEEAAPVSGLDSGDTGWMIVARSEERRGGREC